jgi:hypothetical protein
MRWSQRRRRLAPLRPADRQGRRRHDGHRRGAAACGRSPRGARSAGGPPSMETC